MAISKITSDAIDATDFNLDSDTLTVDATNNRVGVGLDTPLATLHVKNATDINMDNNAAGQLNIQGNGYTGSIALNATGMQIYHNSDARSIIFGTNETERMRIDSSGNVGIGTSSPTSNTILHVKAADAQIELEGTNGSNSAFIDFDGTNLQLSTNRNMIDGAFSNTGKANAAIFLAGASGGSDIKFATASANNTVASERMRIESSGNLLVGKSASDTNASGLELYNDGAIALARSGRPLYVNRLSSDGAVVDFAKDGTLIGSIGTQYSTAYYAGASSTSGVLFNSNGTIPTNSSGSVADNTYDLGQTSARWDDIHATNATIQTSDQNEKQQIASLTDAEITAAKAISKLFKTFKWNSSVTANGDNARTHSGVIAQDVSSAMTDAGLDATKYAFFCSDTWWETQTDVPAVEADEENEIEAQDAYTLTDVYYTAEEAPEGATERTRLGIRYPELLAFVGAATEQRLADIETRLTALENA